MALVNLSYSTLQDGLGREWTSILIEKMEKVPDPMKNGSKFPKFMAQLTMKGEEART